MRIKHLTYFLFGISNIQLLINPGIFWDDWTLYKASNDALMSQFIGNGSVYFGFMHQYLQSFSDPVLIYSLITVVLQILSIYYLFRILELYEKNENKKFSFLYILVMLYAVLPFADTEITMICFPYTLCLSFFVFGCYALVKYDVSGRIIYRIISSIVFVLSFSTASFLFFYLIPVLFILFREELYILYRSRVDKIGYSIKIIILKGVKHFELLVLPIVFFILKSFLFPVSNQYKEVGYNEINLAEISHILPRFFQMFKSLTATLIPYFTQLITNIEFVLILIFLFVLLLVKLPNIKKINTNSFSLILLILGFFVLFIGAFPYLLVNKIPSFYEYNSRHALLLGFGFSPLILGILFLFKPNWLKKSLLSFIISISVTLNVIIQFNYFKGYMLERVYTNIFGDVSRELGDASSTILVDASSNEFTLKGAHSRFYVLSGIYNKINSNERVMIILEKDYERQMKRGVLKKLEPYFYQYNLRNYRLKEPEYKLLIRLNKENIPQIEFFTYYYHYIRGCEEIWNQYFTYEFFELPG